MGRVPEGTKVITEWSRLKVERRGAEVRFPDGGMSCTTMSKLILSTCLDETV